VALIDRFLVEVSGRSLVLLSRDDRGYRLTSFTPELADLNGARYSSLEDAWRIIQEHLRGLSPAATEGPMPSKAA